MKSITTKLHMALYPIFMHFFMMMKLKLMKLGRMIPITKERIETVC